MGLISILKIFIGTDKPQIPHTTASIPKLENIGITEPICPYCDASLDKMPGRKKKCPHCEQFMYVRTRPIDRKKILIKESQIEDVEEQWAIANGTYNDFIAQKELFQNEKEALSRKFGTKASDADVQWSLYQKELIENAKNYDWGLYRTTLLHMGDHLWNESRWNDALRKYLEVCYLDLNGPMNSAGPEFTSEFPAFNLELAMLAPAVVSGVENLASSVDLESRSLKDRFIEIAQIHHKSLKLPRSPRDAWKLLEKELEI